MKTETIDPKTDARNTLTNTIRSLSEAAEKIRADLRISVLEGNNTLLVTYVNVGGRDVELVYGNTYEDLKENKLANKPNCFRLHRRKDLCGAVLFTPEGADKAVRQLAAEGIDARTMNKRVWMEKQADEIEQVVGELVALFDIGTLDAITKKWTAFEDFAALLNAPGYYPSINVGANDDLFVLAEAYDAAMRNRKSGKRAFRY